MKKYFLSALFLLSATCLFFSGSDDDDNNGEEQVVESFSVENFNELELLQNHLVEIDSTGARVQDVCGKNLDESDKTVFFVGVKDLNEAKEIFKSWFPANADLISMGDNMTVNLRDEDRKAQGTVYFTAKESGSVINNLPLLAEVTFAQGTAIKYVTKVCFIPESSWPENSESPYYIGDKVNVGNHNGICIREYSKGQMGMIVSIGKEYFNPEGHGYGACTSAAREAAGVMQKQMNVFKQLFKAIGTELDENEYYWIDKSYYYFFSEGVYAIRLKDSDIDWFETLWKSPKKRTFYVYYFGEEIVF